MTFNFIPVSEVYIDNGINKLKNKSSCGYDNISNKHIKYAKNVQTKLLTLLINQCLYTGIFPSQLKLSRIKPHHHLHLLQEKSIQIITKSNYIAHTEPLLKELRLLK